MAVAAVPRITSALLAAAGGVVHGFFGRQGGVSAGDFAGLNCSRWCGDEAAAVEANIARVGAAVGVRPARVFTNRQAHGCRVRRVDDAADAARVFAGDAQVARAPGVALGVLGADCAPVLLADPAARVIGAAHAGWRGALAGVVEAAVAEMARLGARPARIVCAVGPAIQADSYRVGDDWARRFRAASPVACEACFRRGDGGEGGRGRGGGDRNRGRDGSDRSHGGAGGDSGDWHFDLPGYVRLRLVRAGVRAVAVDLLPHDTFADARFFSHRRAARGRQLSVIALRAGAQLESPPESG